MGEDTIYAPMSGETLAAVSVVRLSGDRAFEIAQKLMTTPPPLRVASVRKLFDPLDGECIDEALVIRFGEGASFTGEETVEFHVHGSTAVRNRLYSLLEQGGARLARPGEFSWRRYAAGLFDLSQAEALSALIAAETETQRKHAQDVLNGRLGRQVKVWRKSVLDILALVEASIDFSEEDIGDEILSRAAIDVNRLTQKFEQELDAVELDELALSTLTVAIIGAPNVGKSTLLNRLTSHDAAIVSDIEGTTRDLVRATVMLRGATIEFVDTAGLHETPDAIEAIGIEKARKIASTAEVRLIVLSSDVLQKSGSAIEQRRPSDIVVWNKSDLRAPTDEERSRFAIDAVVSQDMPQSIEALRSLIVAKTESKSTVTSPISGSLRRKQVFRRAVVALQAAGERLSDDRPEDAAEHLRNSANTLVEMIGSVDSEDVYDTIFSSFCIGK